MLSEIGHFFVVVVVSCLKTCYIYIYALHGIHKYGLVTFSAVNPLFACGFVVSFPELCVILLSFNLFIH